MLYQLSYSGFPFPAFRWLTPFQGDQTAGWRALPRLSEDEKGRVAPAFTGCNQAFPSPFKMESEGVKSNSRPSGVKKNLAFPAVWVSRTLLFSVFSDVRLISFGGSLPLRGAAMFHPSWHYELHGKPCGPVPGTEIARLLAEGAIDFRTRVWREGMPDWAPLEDVWSPPSPAEKQEDAEPAELPWEKERTLGSALSTLGLILQAPTAAFSRLRFGTGPLNSLLFNIIFSTLFGGIVVLAYRSILPSWMPPETELPPGGIKQMVPQILLLAPFVIAASAALQAGFIHLCLILLGAARNSFHATFTTCNYVSGAAAVFAIVPMLGPALMTAWSAFALSVGLAVAHDVPWKRTALAVAIPVGLGFLLALL